MAAFKTAAVLGVGVFLAVAPYHTDAAMPAEDTAKILTAVNTATGTMGEIIQVTEEQVFDFGVHQAEFMRIRAGDWTAPFS